MFLTIVVQLLQHCTSSLRHSSVIHFNSKLGEYPLFLTQLNRDIDLQNNMCVSVCECVSVRVSLPAQELQGGRAGKDTLPCVQWW
jgi:hypothetical protein